MDPTHQTERSDKNDDLRVNFFRPQPGFMRKEVMIIWGTLIAWAFVTFGLPIHIALQHSDPQLTLEEVPKIFGIPLYYLFEGQFVIVWFILICFVFNVLIDWLTTSYRSRR